MGRRGPPPKPTRLKLITGNPGHRRLNPNEPKVPVGAPLCPSWLSPQAKAVWRRIVPLLTAMGLIGRTDRDALAAYCVTYARWRAAEEWIAKHGEVFPLKDERGNVRCLVPFPQVSIARHLLRDLRGYQQEFGMTPSARSRIELPAGGGPVLFPVPSFPDADGEDPFA